jgi:hypothetical protein
VAFIVAIEVWVMEHRGRMGHLGETCLYVCLRLERNHMHIADMADANVGTRRVIV